MGDRVRELVVTVIAIILVVAAVKALMMVPGLELIAAVVSSWSMEPTLHVGDLVISTKLFGVGIGDVAVYRSGFGRLIVHRIVNSSDSGFILKGDANPVPDAFPVPGERIKGKVVLVVPYVGTLRLAIDKVLQRLLGIRLPSI